MHSDIINQAAERKKTSQPAKRRLTGWLARY
jgi:hypothetical protein